MSSVQVTPPGSQSTFLRAMPRLQTCVSRSRRCVPSDRMRATALPTVPKPTSATESAAPSPPLLDIGVRSVKSQQKSHHPFSG